MLIGTTGAAQTTDRVPRLEWLAQHDWDWGVKAGVRFPGIYEAGVICSNGAAVPFGLVTASVANEFVTEYSWLNPKVSVEVGAWFLGARLSGVDYIYQGKHDLRLRPEAGLTLLGVINLYMGYDLNLNSHFHDFIPRDALTFTINLPFMSSKWPV